MPGGFLSKIGRVGLSKSSIWGMHGGMGTHAKTTTEPYIPVLSFSEGIGEKFLESIGIGGADEGAFSHDVLQSRVELFRLYDNNPEGIQPVLRRAHAILMLVRFLDRASMDQVREADRIVHAEPFMPKSMLILREPGETEFKISCAYCGQKLWVRDHDAGKRGNCPQCRKTFFLPTQKSYLASYLMLTESVPVYEAVMGEASCRKAMDSLLGRILDHEQALKSNTTRVTIPPENGV